MTIYKVTWQSEQGEHSEFHTDREQALELEEELDAEVSSFDLNDDQALQTFLKTISY